MNMFYVRQLLNSINTMLFLVVMTPAMILTAEQNREDECKQKCLTQASFYIREYADYIAFRNSDYRVDDRDPKEFKEAQRRYRVCIRKCPGASASAKVYLKCSPPNVTKYPNCSEESHPD